MADDTEVLVPQIHEDRLPGSEAVVQPGKVHASQHRQGKRSPKAPVDFDQFRAAVSLINLEFDHHRTAPAKLAN